MVWYFTPIWLLAQLTSNTPAFTIGSAAFWLAIAVILCLTELLLAKTLLAKYKLAALIVGAIAGLVGLFLALSVIRDYPLVPTFEWQVAYWMGLSLVSVIWVRPMLLRSKKNVIREATEAKTLTEILPGETGRVLYEGTSWAARSEHEQLTIPSNQKVYVVRREGTTLIVRWNKFFHS